MKYTLTASIAVLTLSVAALAQEPKPAPPQFKTLLPAIDLQDGDTLVFLGDSITHQCLYTQYVEDYFYTRHPKARIHFHNSGVGGDRAKDALTRFDEDVAAYKPKYVTILLGMNDGSYRDFDKPIFDTYQLGMNTILDKIAALNATAIPMTPTMHDARASRVKGGQEPRDTYYNGVLSLYGAWLREQSQVRGLGFVDMWSPLNSLTLEKRKTDANWTMIKDAVHPGASGQTVMAVAIIEDMVKKSPVSTVAIDIAPTPASKGDNCKIENLVIGPGKLTFTQTAGALPWVLPPDTVEGQQLTKLGHRYSSEKLTVRQLVPGNYSLKIDGTEVGQYTDAQLSAGVELQSNEKTPQYQQALAVAMLNKQRNDAAYHPIRDQYGSLKGKRRDLQKIIDANDPMLDVKKAEFEQWYTEMKAKVADFLGKAKGFEDQIYQANQPKPRAYELTIIK